jgi:hypothetical protein
LGEDLTLNDHKRRCDDHSSGVDGSIGRWSREEVECRVIEVELVYRVGEGVSASVTDRVSECVLTRLHGFKVAESIKVVCSSSTSIWTT